MPVHILLTKSDKLKKGPAKNTLLKVRKDTAHYGDQVTVQLFSALKGTGLGELKSVLNHWLTDTSIYEAIEDFEEGPATEQAAEHQDQ